MLRAGAAAVDITPPLDVALAGSFTPRPAAGVDDPLFARAVVLEDERGPESRVAIVGCDIICLPGEIVRRARDLAARWAGVSPERVMVAATHTHTAPAPTELHFVPPADAYVAALPERIATAIAAAAQRLRPAGAAWGSGEAPGVAFNRRYRMRDGTVRMNPGRLNPEVVGPAGPTDPEVAVLWLEGEDGAPIASVASFSLHYIGTNDGRHVSADYFGHYARWMQRIFGDGQGRAEPSAGYVPLLLNACSGDVNGVDVSARDPLSGHLLARRVAGIVAGETLRVVQRLRPSPDITVDAAAARFAFPRKAIAPDDLAMAERILALPEQTPPAEIRQRASLPSSGPFSWVVGQLVHDSVLRSYARECRFLAAMPARLETELQVLRVGGCALAALPGEIFVELGLALKQASPFRGDDRTTLLVSLANDYVGYTGTRRAIAEEGSYETWAARTALPAAGEGERMVDAAQALLRRLDERRDA